MKNEIIRLVKSLISIPSVKGESKALKQVLDRALQELNEYNIERFESKGVASVLVYNGRVRPKKFKVILNGHLDVVAGKPEQFKPRIKGNRVYGRGAYDMKAAAAVEILVFKKLAKKISYPLGLQLVTDEEIGGFNGTKYQVERGVKTEFVLAGEPTDFAVSNKAKGIIWAKIKTKGVSAHGANLWEGKNALWKLHKILTKLEKEFPVPKKRVWRTTVNLAKIETPNKTFNKVPDKATAFLDVRYIPKDNDKIVDQLKKVVKGLGKLEIKLKEPSQSSDENNFYFVKLKKSIKKIMGKTAIVVSKDGGSDIRHYTLTNTEGTVFGPLGYGLHTDNEWVDILSLYTYYQILKHFLLSI